MSKQVEGAAAKKSRESKETMAKLLGNVGDHHQMIVIITDLTGATPTHIHVQGPSSDRVLLYGMLEVAKDVVQMSGTSKKDIPDAP